MSLLSFISNRYLYLFPVLMMYTSSTAQSSSKNYVQTKTYLDSGGTTFLRHIDYYDELGYVAETVDVGSNTSQTPLAVKNDNSYYRGVTEMPDAQTHPSTDGKVHILVGSTFSKEQQAITLAHEGFGHGLIYEMTRDPNAASHHYKNKQGNSYVFNGVEYYELIRYDSNKQLKAQIDKVEKETKRNYHNRYILQR